MDRDGMPCPVCGEPMRYGLVPCPDGREGCLVAHHALRCGPCKNRKPKQGKPIVVEDKDDPTLLINILKSRLSESDLRLNLDLKARPMPVRYKTRIFFEATVPPGVEVEVRPSANAILISESIMKKVPLEEVGWYRPEDVVPATPTRCAGLHLSRVVVKNKAGEEREQLVQGGAPLEIFGTNPWSSGTQMDTCFPVSMKLFVKNTTEAPIDLVLYIKGTSLPL